MGLSDILIMDLDPSSCSVDHCGQIAKLLPKFLPDSEVVIQTITNIPPVNTTSLFLYLILLKSSLKEKLHDAVQALKGKWMAVPVLGIFCTNEHRCIFHSARAVGRGGGRDPFAENIQAPR